MKKGRKPRRRKKPKSRAGWQWQDSGPSDWKPYRPADSATIEAAFAAAAPTVTLQFGRTPYTIDIVGCAQINSSTGFSRPIKRVDASGAVTHGGGSGSVPSFGGGGSPFGGSGAEWQWQDSGPSDWKPYRPADSATIEAAFGAWQTSAAAAGAAGAATLTGANAVIGASVMTSSGSGSRTGAGTLLGWKVAGTRTGDTSGGLSSDGYCRVDFRSGGPYNVAMKNVNIVATAAAAPAPSATLAAAAAAAAAAPTTVTLQFGSTPYTIDVVGCAQINSSTGFSRPIKRVDASGAVTHGGGSGSSSGSTPSFGSAPSFGSSGSAPFGGFGSSRPPRGPPRGPPSGFGRPPAAPSAARGPCPFKVGDIVRVMPTISKPQHGWGSVSPGDEGPVTSISGNAVNVAFPSQSGWGNVWWEMELAAPPFAVGDTCRLRAWRVPPADGSWGDVTHADIGSIVAVDGGDPSNITVDWPRVSGWGARTDATRDVIAFNADEGFKVGDCVVDAAAAGAAAAGQAVGIVTAATGSASDFSCSCTHTPLRKMTLAEMEDEVSRGYAGGFCCDKCGGTSEFCWHCFECPFDLCEPCYAERAAAAAAAAEAAPSVPTAVAWSDGASGDAIPLTLVRGGAPKGCFPPAMWPLLGGSDHACDGMERPLPFAVGDLVTLKPEISSPSTGWGQMKRGDAGVCTYVTVGSCRVDFPSQRGWNGSTDELMIDSSCEVGTSVRCRTWKVLEGSIDVTHADVGVVTAKDGSTLTVDWPRLSAWQGSAANIVPDGPLEAGDCVAPVASVSEPLTFGIVTAAAADAVTVTFAASADAAMGDTTTKSVGIADIVRVGFADANMMHESLWPLLGREDGACDGCQRPVEGDRPDEAIAKGFPALSDDLQYTVSDEPDDWSAITRWRVLTPNVDYDPSTECTITRVELGTDEPVVCLCCNSAAISCVFAQSTIVASLNSTGRCPGCGFRHLTRGGQPSGTMQVTKSGPSLETYDYCGTIQISYNFPNGTQTRIHPHPGKSSFLFFFNIIITDSHFYFSICCS